MPRGGLHTSDVRFQRLGCGQGCKATIRSILFNPPVSRASWGQDLKYWRQFSLQAKKSWERAMGIDPRKYEVARIVCDEFIVTRRGATRHPLTVAVKDSFVLDQMVTQTLLREEENRTLYFPTL